MTDAWTLTNERGEWVCGALTKDDTPCMSTKLIKRNGRCRLHGGKSLAGPASPRYKTGRYSKVLLSSASLLDKYEQAQSDARLLSLRDEIQLVDARLGELLERIGGETDGESMRNWTRTASAYADLKSAMQSQNTDGTLKALLLLDVLIERGARESETWAEIHAVIEQRRRLAESERKRLVDMQQMITAERAVSLFAQILDVIRENVSDRDALNRIGQEFERLALAQARD